MPQQTLMWRYFTPVDQKNRRAECKYCKKHLSYKSTVTNLKHHLRIKHNSVYEDFCNNRNMEDNEPDSEPSDSSDIWDSFEKESNNTARCIVCLKVLPRKTSVLKIHLESHHSSNKIDEVDSDNDQQNCYTEVVYLEEDEHDLRTNETKNNPTSFGTPKKRPAPAPYKLNKQKRTSYESMETEIEEIENFGRYVTSLLKKVPKDLCTQLQMDIINLIMTAKLNKMAKQPTPNVTVANVASQSYLVTLPNMPVSNANDGSLNIRSVIRDSNVEEL